MAAILIALGIVAVIVLAVVGFRAAIRHGERRNEWIITEWEAQRNAAPADSTYLDPHRGPGPVLVSPDEGDWRMHGSHFEADARAFRRSWVETGRWDA